MIAVIINCLPSAAVATRESLRRFFASRTRFVPSMNAMRTMPSAATHWIRRSLCSGLYRKTLSFVISLWFSFRVNKIVVLGYIGPLFAAFFATN